MPIRDSITAFGLLRVAAAVPDVAVADVPANVGHCAAAVKRAADAGAAVIVLPELALTGYTAGDLFHQETLLARSRAGLAELARRTARVRALTAVGLPLQIGGALYNCAAILHGGRVLGIVPKTYIPNYKEFYEERWFASARDLPQNTVRFGGRDVPVGTDLLFDIPALPGAMLAVEICEDLWAPLPPSTAAALAGATVIVNLSASNDLVGKADYRLELIRQQSARTMSAYIYTSCGAGESTTDVVFGGHAVIAENGSVLAQTERFIPGPSMAVTDVDVQHLMLERRRTTSFKESLHHLPAAQWRRIEVPVRPATQTSTARFIDAHPFVPSDPAERDRRAREILAIQAAGLARRMRVAGSGKLVLGLSGGLDSTLALLVAVRALRISGLPARNLNCLTMPGFATSRRTKGNAYALANALGVTLDEIDITKGVRRHLADLGHDGKTEDVTFENAQARYRTMLLFDRANQKGGIVVGTGDLSEIALGWCTFNGDHISHYGVNASVPKTLVRYVVAWAAEQKEFSRARRALLDVLDTPVSPELANRNGQDIGQKTEDIIGPYELHDFFLYHSQRWGSDPRKVRWLAEQAFRDTYRPAVITKWLKVFIARFFGNQFKRSVMPDGPKVGSVALSPRGDWRMPSDVGADAWLAELNATK
ncbi:MAG TPA: NAD(+) synthase [Candidatus Paceibacterota bacterium]|nr:NAD(+) synthase [Candidatus Paceibacterota bacterium]